MSALSIIIIVCSLVAIVICVKINMDISWSNRMFKNSQDPKWQAEFNRLCDEWEAENPGKTALIDNIDD